MNGEQLLLEIDKLLKNNDEYWVDWMNYEVFKKTQITNVKDYTEDYYLYKIEGMEGLYFKMDGVYYLRYITQTYLPENKELLIKLLDDLKN